MDILVTLLPTFAIVGAGYFLKRQKVLDASVGRSLLKFVFLVTAPALAIRSISQLPLDTSLLAFIILPVVLTGTSYVLIKPLESKIHLKPKQFAVFLMATMAINSGFSLPFIVSLSGDAGAARVALFNVVNGVMIFGWVYAIALSYGDRAQLSRTDVAKKVLLTPAFAALIIALVMNLASVAIPPWLSPTINTLANLTGPMILLALGLVFEPRLMFPLPTFVSLAVRMIGGLIIGVMFVTLFGLTGADKIAVLLLSASPVGLNTVTFSSLEKLDDEFAASIVGVGLMGGLVLTSILTIFLR